MKVLVCHPGTQHAGKLAALLARQGILGGFITGFRPRADSMLARYLRLSGLRTLDESVKDRTTQIRLPELFGKVAQSLGWTGDSLMRIRNGWFQKAIPKNAIASNDVVVGFDTASWVLARRTRDIGKPFVLDRSAVHRSTQARIRASMPRAGTGATMTSPASSGVQEELESAEMTLASRIVVASRFSERSVLDAGIVAEKVVLNAYGVNSEWFAGGGDRNGAPGKCVFLFVGHVTINKGVGVLLDAWERLADVNAELWLAGGGDSALIETARNTRGVRVLGKLGPDELRNAYLRASVFVFPTFCDGFGMVLLEAMASGLPIIATPNCAAPELTRDGEAGVIFPTGDPAALCLAMADACTNRSLWRERGAAAKEVAKAYTWDAYGSRWAALLREVVT